MAWDHDSHRIYARTRAQALRDGCSVYIARRRALDAVHKHQGVAARPRRGDTAIDQGPAPTRAAAGLTHSAHVDVSDAIWADALRVRNHQHDLIIAELCGDPVPGRSALDRMSAEERARVM